jgi:hypothetical protein
MVWIGWLLGVLPSLLLLFSGTMELVKAEPVVQGFEHLGYPEHLAPIIGIVEVGSFDRWKPKAGCCIKTGISTTPPTSSFGHGTYHPTS